MNEIGQTKDGEVIVAMSRREYNLLLRLQQATYKMRGDHWSVLREDMLPWLQIICQYTELVKSIDYAQISLDALRELIKPEEAKDDED